MALQAILSHVLLVEGAGQKGDGSGEEGEIEAEDEGEGGVEAAFAWGNGVDNCRLVEISAYSDQLGNGSGSSASLSASARPV